MPQSILISISLFFCVIQFSCKPQSEKTLNGYPYQIISSKNMNKPEPGQIIYYYQAIHSEEFLNEVPNYSESYNIFRFVDDQMLIQLNNPTYDLLKYLGQHEEGKVIYTKSTDKKYPNEYGNGKKVIFYIKVIDILSEKQHQQNEIKKREKLMQSREDYFNKGLTIDSLVRIHLIDIKNSEANNELEGIKILPLESRTNTSKNNNLANANLKISYSAYTLNGDKITSSFNNREPYITLLTSDKIPPGWHKILHQMNEKEEVFCLIPAKLLYGTAGFKGNVTIPPNTDLIFYFKIEEVLRN